MKIPVEHRKLHEAIQYEAIQFGIGKLTYLYGKDTEKTANWS